MRPVSFLLACVFIGLISIAVQVLSIREFMVVFFGNELCLGIILGGWLTGIALGAGIGGKIAGKTSRAFPLFIALQVMLCFLPLIQIYCIRTIRDILLIPPGEYINLASLITATFIITFPFSFTIGLIFPCACVLYTGQKKKPAQYIGLVYIMEALGSLAGGALITFYMINHFKPYEIISIIGALILLNSAVLCLSRDQPHRLVPGLLCLLLGIATSYLLLAGYIFKVDELLVQKRWDSYHNHLKKLISLDSPYQNIVLALGEDQYSIYGNGQYITSFPDPYQAAILAHFSLSQHPEPRKILLVGGGATGIIQEITKYPIELLHYVELDPLVITASLPYLSARDRGALEDPRVSLFFQDGRYFIKQARERYDMVIVNLPDPATAMLNRFYTLEFFQEVQEKLAQGGVLVTGITASDNYLGEEVGMYARSLYHTLKKVFPHIIIAPGFKNHFFATAVPHAITDDPALLAERYQARNILSDYFTPYHFSMLFPEDRASFLKREMERKPSVQINTDAWPVTYYYNLLLWENIAGERGKTRFFQGIAGTFRWLVLPMVLLFLLRAVYVLATKRRLEHHLDCNALLAIATTGFAGMALEIILLFSFQNIYGYVYHEVGLIVAIFMLGLAAGGFQMNQLVAGKERSWVMILTLLEIIIGVYSIALPFLINLFSALGPQARDGIIDFRYLFLLMIAGAGWLTGLEFPLVSMIFINRYPVGKVAGRVDSLDHLGACLGALLTGTILVPVLGIYQSCFITGILNLMSGMLLIVYMLQKGR